MAHIVNPPPPEAIKTLETTLDQIAALAARPGDSPIFPSGYASKRRLNAAYPLFFLSLQELAEGKHIAGAQKSGWRFSLTYESGLIASAEVTFDPASSTYHFGEICSSKSCQDSISLLQHLATEPDSEYEPRILMLPSLHTELFWLAVRDNTRDILGPLPPAPDFLPRDKSRFSADELMPLLQKAAKQKMGKTTKTSS
jgi:hypothetical protein